jgi:hypothetical protein
MLERLCHAHSADSVGTMRYLSSLYASQWESSLP